VPVPTDAITAHHSLDTFYDEKGNLYMHHRRHLALLGSILFAVSMLFAFTSTAFADTAADSVSASTPANTITCRAHISATPFLAGNTAQAVGSVACTAPVESLIITVDLFRDNIDVKSAGSVLAFRSSIFAIPKYTCKTALHIHHFFAAMTATVTFPPGYVPHSHQFNLVSGIIGLAC
jgi:hypothetical protein